MRKIDWDNQPLGEMPDCVLARRLQVHHMAVRRQRLSRDIPAFNARPDIDWEAQPLGEVSDDRLAKRLGISKNAVRYQRRMREIKSYKKANPEHFVSSPELIAEALALVDDGLSRRAVARRLGISSSVVSKWVTKRENGGISDDGRPAEEWQQPERYHREHRPLGQHPRYLEAQGRGWASTRP